MIMNFSHHDALFKLFLGDITVAQDFLEIHLPPSLRRLCDFTTLKICPTSFVEDDLSYHTCDMLYSVDTAKGAGYIYCLIEHQSRPDKLMAFRLMRYSLAAMKQHIDQGFTQLPLVIPLLFYHGGNNYPYSTCWLDCLSQKELAKDIYFNPFLLVDVTAISDNEIMTHRRVALLELVQKHIRQRDMLALTDKIGTLMDQWPLPLEFRKGIMYYIAKAGDTNDVKRFMSKLSQRKSSYQEEMMSIAQKLEELGLQKGLQKGRQEGIYHVARQLLIEGVDRLLVKKYTGLSDEELNRLAH
ncbi:Rpn family recombination-promoting nuclease/putative transposase [Sodalis sp. RH21]|uniref:Rpn family recombination-promoting nuclease/putative transposase n=1 Tax=unclassified Sodalis (in: enterobacteria) TaxID=2636512 RepID=UPI0039B5DE5E